MENNEKVYIGDSFFERWFSKFLFTLISVKVWGLVAATVVSTYLLIHCKIDRGDWLTFNTTIWALIFGMKEVFKISENKDIAEQQKLQKQIDSNIEIATIRAKSDDDPTKTSRNHDGTIIVGSEPD
ncbi:MAG: hypothetical protein RIC06_01905 [Cyclobacteriaceae bacterium]